MKYLPKILVIEQFSYRFLTQAVWAGTLLVSIAIKIFTNGKNSIKTHIFSLIIICFSSSSWLRTEYDHAAPITSIVSGSLRNYVKAYLMKSTDELKKKNNKKLLMMDHMMVRTHCNKAIDQLNSQLSVPAEGLFEFPIIYYPNLLSVNVDGNKIYYFQSKFQEYYLVGLRLSTGEHNILIRFTGLVWANWLSFIAWVFVIIIGFFHLIKKLFKSISFVRDVNLI